MGTRGCVGWTVDGKNYIETYNHFDSYVDGLGCAMLEAIKVMDLKKLQDNLSTITEIDNGEKIASKSMQKKYKKYSSNPNGLEEQKFTWYWLLRELQGVKNLIEIEKGNVSHVITNNGWLNDSLFCEYGYTLNFKTNVLEFWRGFQKDSKTDKYIRCKKVGKIPFSVVKKTSIDNLVTMAKKFYKEK